MVCSEWPLTIPVDWLGLAWPLDFEKKQDSFSQLRRPQNKTLTTTIETGISCTLTANYYYVR